MVGSMGKDGASQSSGELVTAIKGVFEEHGVLDAIKKHEEYEKLEGLTVGRPTLKNTFDGNGLSSTSTIIDKSLEVLRGTGIQPDVKQNTRAALKRLNKIPWPR